MRTLRTANEVKAVTLTELETLRKRQKREALGALGHDKQKLLQIMDRYIRNRRLLFWRWLPVLQFPSSHYRHSGDYGLRALEWEAENVKVQFVYEDGWNALYVFDQGNKVNEEKLGRFKTKLQREFPFFTIRVYNGDKEI